MDFHGFPWIFHRFPWIFPAFLLFSTDPHGSNSPFLPGSPSSRILLHPKKNPRKNPNPLPSPSFTSRPKITGKEKKNQNQENPGRRKKKNKTNQKNREKARGDNFLGVNEVLQKQTRPRPNKISQVINFSNFPGRMGWEC